MLLGVSGGVSFLAVIVLMTNDSAMESLPNTHRCQFSNFVAGLVTFQIVLVTILQNEVLLLETSRDSETPPKAGDGHPLWPDCKRMALM